MAMSGPKIRIIEEQVAGQFIGWPAVVRRLCAWDMLKGVDEARVTRATAEFGRGEKLGSGLLDENAHECGELEQIGGSGVKDEWDMIPDGEGACFYSA